MAALPPKVADEINQLRKHIDMLNQQINVLNERVRRLEKRRTNEGWMNCEISALVELCLMYPRNDTKIWNVISNRTRERNFQRSNSSCSNKFRVLLGNFEEAGTG